MSDGLPVRLELHAHGDRDSTYLAAVSFFDASFEEGWRITYVMQELDTGSHEDLGRVDPDDAWDVEYNAIGVLR